MALVNTVQSNIYLVLHDLDSLSSKYLPKPYKKLIKIITINRYYSMY